MRHSLRGVGARLSLALLAVVAGALGVVYLVVVPSLENRLVDSRVSDLERAVSVLGNQLPGDRFGWPDFLERAAASANARVVIYDVFRPPLTLLVVGDSRGLSSEDVTTDSIAVRVARTYAPAAGTTSHEGERFAEAAVPVGGGATILLVSSSLEDALDNVALVRNRLLFAGALGLIAALALGYGGAWLFARRLQRLERAAERIAGGRFDEPVVDEGSDEVGELARAFERMRERLAALDHARREFVANASHELRTPLFALGGFVELLRDEDLDEATRRDFVLSMSEQVERLTKLASELLDLSRADAGRLHVEREPLDLAEIAADVVEEFTAVARAGGREVVLEQDGHVPALGDGPRVHQIGRILVENALVHTPPPATVTVSSRSGEEGAALSVIDDGPGVPPEHVAHVFERFYRIEGERASGSGLGLAIARELARLMGGSLELDSRPGRTVFTLRLPSPVVIPDNNTIVPEG